MDKIDGKNHIKIRDSSSYPRCRRFKSHRRYQRQVAAPNIAIHVGGLRYFCCPKGSIHSGNFCQRQVVVPNIAIHVGGLRYFCYPKGDIHPVVFASGKLPLPISQFTLVGCDILIARKEIAIPAVFATSGQQSKEAEAGAGQSKTFAYGYDKIGNRQYESVTENNQTTTSKYTYNNLYQLTKVEKGAGAYGDITNWLLEKSYAYDDFGNQTLEETYQVDTTANTSTRLGEVKYSYDKANQLIKTETKEQGQSDYTLQSRNVYNGEGQRIRSYEGEDTVFTQYFYMGGALAFTAKGDPSSLVGENILDPYGTILASNRENAEEDGNQYWIYHYDPQGSTTNIVGSDGTKVIRAESNIYDPFGKVEASQSTIQNNIKYTGAIQDTNSLTYLGSRHYDPNTGRFLQQDTYKGDEFAPWTQNLYTYTSNNPVNYTDPTGHSATATTSLLWELVKIAGGIGSSVSAGVVGGVLLAVGLLLTGESASASQRKHSPASASTTVKKGTYTPPATTIPLGRTIPLTRAQQEIKEKEEDIATTTDLTKEKDKKQVVFPQNPEEFRPLGLTRRDYPGTSNGRIYKWGYTDVKGKRVEIFEWDEGTNEPLGQHYHIMTPEMKNKHVNEDGEVEHYFPGDPILEPWRSIYFPYGM